VAKFDVKTRKIVKRVSFPRGSKPYMLRVSPDGGQLWVQASGANTNSILDPSTLDIKDTQPESHSPITNAWSPDGRYALITHDPDPSITIRDGRTGKKVKRIEVGPGSANIGFTPDAKTAYVSVTGTNQVAVIDLTSLTVASQIPVGNQPVGLIVMLPF